MPGVGLREWLARPWTVVGLALAVVGVLFVLVWVQSPSMLYWTGEKVIGHNRDGLVYYRVDGENNTIDDTRPIPPYNTPVTVYVNPQEPSQALIEKPARWLDAVGVLGWFAAAAACLLWSALRPAVRRRRAGSTAADYGDGLDPEWVSQRLKRAGPHPGRNR